MTLHVPEEAVDEYGMIAPWSQFGRIVSIPKHTLTYMVDGEVYKTVEVEEGEEIIQEAEPTKEGYTFSGWDMVPANMPAHDVTATGSFTINSYTLTYMVDDEVYKTYTVEYGATVEEEVAPEKEGYIFSGWSEMLTTMPAHDVTVTGSFTINSYTLTYMVDDEVYKTYTVEYGATVEEEAAPEKEGYIFSGWSEMLATMPAHDVTVTASFTINSYTLTYMVDDEVYKTYTVEYGATVEEEGAPEKEGYIFSGWSEMLETMPAHDVTITGNFTFVDGIAGVSMDGKTDGIYTLDGRKIEKLQKGVNIVKMPDGHVKKVFVK
ncbi:MAG: InlB B-repeat-containing protein [Bacteroidaceae bacterium]|nr:InlB B-repeat-containing protein [Bacteroidaceae bacterium]